MFYALEALRARGDISLCAIAPGEPGGDMAALREQSAALAPREYDDYRQLLARERPDIAVVNPVFGSIARITMDCLNAGAHCFS